MSLRPSRWVPLVFAGALALAPGPAFADEHTAAQLFESGQAAYDRGDHPAAARAFEASFAAEPRGVSAYNAAAAWLLAGEKARAADWYRDALARNDLTATARADAESRLHVLRRSCGWVRVTGKDGTEVSVAHVERARVPITFHLLPGTYTLRIGEGTETLPIEVIAGRETAVAVAVASAVASATPPAATPTNAPSTERVSKPATPEAVATPESSTSTSRVVGWSLVGFGALAVGAAVTFGAIGLDARDRFEQSRRRDEDARADAIAYRSIANVSWGVALVSGIAGITLIATSGAPAKASARVGAGFGTVDVTARF